MVASDLGIKSIMISGAHNSLESCQGHVNNCSIKHELCFNRNISLFGALSRLLEFLTGQSAQIVEV